MVAPLHWGLGHATRCIPIIRALSGYGYNVLLASDGPALILLRKEFPDLPFLELPSYNITYPKNGNYFRWKLLMNLPQIQKTIKAEKKVVKELVAKGEVDGIISDNRFGVRNKDVPSVFITHQLNVLTGGTSYFSSKIHQNIIRKFDQCWVPDVADIVMNLSGKLGHLDEELPNVKYIGILSRMVKKELPKKYDFLLLLSGPEPQRSLLEKKLLNEFKNSEKAILLVQGKVEEKQNLTKRNNIEIVNFLKSDGLEKAINECEVVISRSGYTTIMDLAALEKKAFFIPTPGQYEQEYLAKRLKELGRVPSCRQEKFRVKKLDKVAVYKGLKNYSQTPNFKDLFSLFQGK